MVALSNLKPFLFNLNDVEYVLAQVNFLPLFDENGNAIIAWDGTGAIYDINKNQLWDGSTGGYDAATAQGIWGTSYAQVTSTQGIRTISGEDNNLLLVNRTWGAADAEFVRQLGTNYTFLNQIYDPAATTGLPYGTSPAVIETALDAIAATETANSTVVSETAPINVATYLSLLSGVTYTIQYFNRTTQDIITSTHVIDGGHEFVTWNKVDVATQERTELIIVDSTGEHVDHVLSTTGPSPMTSHIFMSGGELDLNYHNFASLGVNNAADLQALINQGYAPTSVNNVATSATDFENGTLTPDVNADVRVDHVIDYTPRMISNTITTGGVKMLTVADLYSDPNVIPSTLNPNHIVYNTPFLNDGLTANPAYQQGQDPSAANFKLGAVEGIALVKDYGLLADLGIDDHQNPNNGESFVGSTNPGVAPSNGFFAIFGQFFDHGLDFITKNGQTDAGETAKIKIALAVDDPLYGVIGPDGQPTTEITITRATPAGIDENGAVRYVNHTSPYVDQSQSYGSHDEVAALLREWVEDPNNPGSYVMGTDLIDSDTLANSWTRWDGVETHQTLISVNTLREHMAATGRDDLSWEDIGNVRNRDANGDVIADGQAGAGTSGHALLLDMNPRFDAAHLYNGSNAQDSELDAAIGLLNAQVKTEFGATSYFEVNATTNKLTLHLETLPPGTPPGTPNTMEGAAALFPFVNFADFSINPASQVVHDAVSTILLASIGDHYLSGDGRVNENVGLTSIHHVFHEEHNFQVSNIQEWVLRHDDNANDGHVLAGQWMTEVTNTTTQITNVNVSVVGGHYEATGGYLASDVNGDIYVIGTNDLATAQADPNFVDFVRTPPMVDAQGNLEKGDAISAAGLLTRADGYLSWDLEKVFQGARLVVETEYNHVATDQFANAVTPDMPEFVGYNSGRDASITLEYGQAAYRYGHSTLRETIDVVDPDGGLTGRVMSYALEAAFLKPELYAEVGPDALILGQTRQQMNEVDEFVTPALNQGLLGLPLDLAAINIARGRDIGLATLNEMRVALGFGAYQSWNDYGNNMQHSESLVNYVAAYAWDGNVELAQAIIDAAGGNGAALAAIDMSLLKANAGDQDPFTAGNSAEASAWANKFMSGDATAFHSDTVNLIDAWIGGLGEVHVNGGLLGEMFNAIFVDQITALKDGDRLYYLYRLFGENLDEEIKAEQFKDLVERTTGTSNLNGNIFGYAEGYETTKLNATWKSGVDLYNSGGDVVVLAGDYFDPGVTYYSSSGTVISGIPTAEDLYNAAGTSILGAGGIPSADVVYYNADGKFIGADQHRYGQIIAAHAGDANGLNLDGSQNYGIGIYSDGGTSTAENGTLMDFNAIMAAGTQKFIRDIRVAINGVSVQLDGEPGSGADAGEVLVGTEFDDVIFARAGDDTVYGEGGNDLIYGGNGADWLYGGDGHDEIHGGDGPEVIDGGFGDDWLYGDSSESAAGGIDLLIGGEGNDVIFGGVGIDSITGNGGDDIIFGGGDTDPFTRAGDGNDYVDGGAVGDILYGDNGDDLIVGGDDQDIVEGNDGDDILRPGLPSQALGGGPDEVLGGDGITDTGFDLLELNDFDASPIGEMVDLNNQANPLVALDGITPQFSMTQVEGVIGSQNNDVLIGNDIAGGGLGYTLDNWFIGGSGSDTFTGKAGNDVIIGGSIRLDALIGRYEVTAGTRADYVTYDPFVGASHRVDPDATLSNGLLGNADIGTQVFDKHFTEFLKTDMFKDYVLGNAEAVFDPLNPEASGSGVAQDDSSSTDVAIYSGNRTDYTVSQISFTASGTSTPIIAYKIIDNRPQDFATGLLLADGITIGDGTDILLGVEKIQFADMTLDMSQFANQPATGAAVISGFATANTTNVTAPVNPFGPLNLDISTIADADGFTGPMQIQWQASADAGMSWTNIAGATSLQYQAMASDVGLQLRAMVSFVDDTGVLETVMSAPTDVVGEYMEDARGTNQGELQGNAGQDILIGFGGDDQLQGNDGNDWLNGGGGNDEMQGGAGDDIYIVNSAGDTVSEGGSGGMDEVRASISYTLGNNVENLILTGSATNATGNALDNIIRGNAGNNTIIGAGGNDTIYGGNGNDTIIWNAGDGTDLVNGGAPSPNDGNPLTYDTFAVHGNADAETFDIWAANMFGSLPVGLPASWAFNPQIVITRTVGGIAEVVAGLRQIEELTFNTAFGVDTVAVHGDLSGILNANTITINSNGSHVVVDISQMTSSEHVVLNTGGTYEIVGNGSGGVEVNGVMISGSPPASSGGATGTGDPAPTIIVGDVETFVGGSQSEVVIGTDATKVIYADGGDDIVTTGDLRTIVMAGDGDDTVDGGAAGDILFGGTGADLVDGHGGSDKIFGDDGDDIIYGGDGDDLLFGNAGNDEIHGGSGQDRIEGGEGVDLLFGGDGDDMFVFRSADEADGDTIADFHSGDVIDLSFIDANGAEAGNGSFSILSTSSFTASGQLIVNFDATKNATTIEGNTDGDTATTEFHLLINGDHVEAILHNNGSVIV